MTSNEKTQSRVNCDWILGDRSFGENLIGLEKTILNSGSKIFTIKYIPFSGGLYQCDALEDQPAIFYGALNQAKYIQNKTQYIPGTFANFDQLRCINYYPAYDVFLLNKDYWIIPLSEMIRRKEEVFDRFQAAGKVFLRPDSGMKPFIGQLLSYENFNLDEIGIRYFQDPHLLSLVSSPKEIKSEYRLFVAGKDILSHCKSHEDDILCNRYLPAPQKVLDFVQNVLNTVQFEIDPVAVIDIAEIAETTETDRAVGGELSILEWNSMSSSGFYWCPPEPVVDRVNKEAVREFEEYQYAIL